MEELKKNDRQEDIYTKVVKAGKRTYFFDIKSTRGNDFYVTITESKKIIEDGKEIFQKHKLFLYKEDFEKFRDGFIETIQKLEELKENNNQDSVSSLEEESGEKISSLTFESL